METNNKKDYAIEFLKHQWYSLKAQLFVHERRWEIEDFPYAERTINELKERIESIENLLKKLGVTME